MKPITKWDSWDWVNAFNVSWLSLQVIGGAVAIIMILAVSPVISGALVAFWLWMKLSKGD